MIIESAVHKTDLTEYTKEKARQVISFGLEKWNLLEKDSRFRSVIYFRNYGPESGGSQRHPHSQIIGLEGLRLQRQYRPRKLSGNNLS